MSGPLLDRLDLQVEVGALRYADLAAGPPGEASAVVRARVLAARARQVERGRQQNASLTPGRLRQLVRLTDGARRLLARAVDGAGLSARAHDRVLRVALTVADLEAAAEGGGDGDPESRRADGEPGSNHGDRDPGAGPDAPDAGTGERDAGARERNAGAGERGQHGAGAAERGPVLLSDRHVAEALSYRRLEPGPRPAPGGDGFGAEGGAAAVTARAGGGSGDGTASAGGWP